MTTLSAEEYILNNGESNLIPVEAFGSPKFGVVMFDNAVPGCTTALVLPIPCLLGSIYLTNEGLALRNLLNDAQLCGWRIPESNFRLPSMQSILSQNANQSLPSVISGSLNSLYYIKNYKESQISKRLEIFGNLVTNQSFIEFEAIFERFIENESLISITDSLQILNELIQFDIEPRYVISMISRWNNSIRAWNLGILEPNNEYPNIIIKSNLQYHNDIIKAVVDYSTSRGFSSVDSLYNFELTQINNYSLENDPTINPVCASVGISLSQKLTMTREAFEGTLKVFNGNPTTQMDSIKLNLVILNEDGVISNDLFEIETTSLEFLSAIDGTGTLAGDKEGIAKILFIPEIGAAPTIPKFYSFGGSISYIDPFGGLKVTMPLVPVTLQVNPSPNLKLHYFLQRDIISDDPLTTKIEPTLPASLAVMIENNGYGVAANLRIQSAQPQVIDNEKGLALNMNFIGSKLQGQAATMGLTNINFGNINPLSTKIGEWIFTSNVLGHFIGYATSVRHLSSRGNPNLSLVEGAELHEWIKSVQVYGSQSDGINDFLVNEIPDAEDRPDAIYLSQGNVVNTVEYAQTGSFLNPILFPTFTNTLSVDPTATGWNYIKLNDPGNGEYDLVSVTRNVDNQSIPLDNAWLTFVTIPDTKVPKYEYKFHFVDNFADSLPKSYTVVWSPKDPTPPFVDTIVGAPVQVTASKVNTLKVIFSEPIDESTFTIADITLINQGGPNLIDSNVPITKLDSITYLIDISSKTNMNGYFVFTVQTTGITDVTGTNGFYAKQVSWTQYLTVPVVQEFIDFPVSGITSAYDTVRIKFNLAIDTSSLRANDFIVKKDGVSIPGSIDVSLVFSDFRTFELRGIHNLLTTDGLYTLGIILPSIKSTTNIFGLDTQYFSFVLDTKGPDIVSITKLNTGSLDAQHVTGVQISFDEIIMSFDTTSLFLYKDNIQAQISPITLQKLTGSKYNVLWKADASYGNGIYKFLIDETKFKDVTNIFGSGKDSITWVTSRSSGLIISNLYIDPDYGYSSMDGVTYQRNGTFYCTLSETGTDLRLYQQDNSGALILLNSLPMSQVGQSAALPYTVSSTGNTTLVIKVKDQYGNEVSKSKVITIDDVALNGVWSLPQNLNFVSQPDSLNYFFGNKLLNTNLTSPNIIRIYKDNIEISNPGFIISVLNDSTFRVKGIPMIGNTPGQYKLSWNKSFYQKYISGKPGEGTSDLIWRIVNSNGAPIANAGADIILKDLGLVGLNGSGSYDPDSDPLSYKWISLDQVTLSDSTAVSPNFVATEKHVGKVLTFLLLVSDGSKTSSDLVRVFIELDDILLNTKIFLQGPYSDSDGLMSDQLRVQNLIPLAHPYTDISRYKFGNKSKNVIPAIFQVQGNDAIVDWVYIEIKDVDKDSILNGGAFLLQRDGDIVDSNGVSSAVFLNIPKGKYSISVFHRNHVPIRTSSFINIILNKIENVDLTQDPLKILGDINAVNSISGIYVMMSGDADRNGQVQQIDVHQCFGKLNEMGYLTEDLDMNGTVERIDIDMKLLPNLGRGKQF
ncbi:MAG: hypothetical protein IPL55_06905 [Saprospiraceae bacterium]|nr:hypothetical protein [Saprospiraceae bacterium]